MKMKMRYERVRSTRGKYTESTQSTVAGCGVKELSSEW